VGAATLVALVVVHAVVGHVLPMHMTVVQVVDVVPVHDRVVTAAGTVGVAMYFRRSMLNRRHWTQPLADLMQRCSYAQRCMTNRNGTKHPSR